MPGASIRIGNQTSRHVPARVPYEFAVAHGFDAFEWLSDKGLWGWCEEDMPQAERAELGSSSWTGSATMSRSFTGTRTRTGVTGTVIYLYSQGLPRTMTVVYGGWFGA